MRKVLGFVIALATVFFLGMAFTQLARADGSSPDCKSDLATSIVALQKAGGTKILEMQYDLTLMKLARETLSANQKTVEGYIKKQEVAIKKLDDKQIRPQLLNLYSRFGEETDLDKINAEAEKGLQSGIKKIKTASYFKPSTRFKNRDLSAYVLAHAVSDEEATFDRNDAAILWYQAQISEGVEAIAGRGSATANLQEASTRVAQLTGVAGTVGETTDKLIDDVKVQEKVINDEFDRLTQLYTDFQKKSCADAGICPDCSVSDAESRQKVMNTVVLKMTTEIAKDPSALNDKIKKITAKIKSHDIQVKRDEGEAPTPAPSSK